MRRVFCPAKGCKIPRSLPLSEHLLVSDFEVAREAVLAAGVMRLRPILPTAFAIILGTLIMAFDPVFGGLAITLIYGTFASTALTLFVIPLAYFIYEHRRAAV